ncbi:macro domain-like protein [Sparassis crispa]|uniref:Macro domain-like protein n=1 Tax=Sparassis crispa TaxID=139825 RepID=A0A401GI10_9APHY|nr:macro domain-like protein [Sparassis crispa]GBE81763.1 macro domain-like protein [Sparassis crispa]
MLPRFIFIAPEPRPPRKAGVKPKTSLCASWKQAIQEHLSTDESFITVIEGKFNGIDAEKLRCDCIVSPANSFGIMDGGFDLELSRYLKGTGDMWSLTNHCQAYIRETWHGFVPPGSCTLVPLPDDVAGPNNAWHIRVVAMVPTMRTPEDVSWHQDIIYSCMWSLLVQLEHWNKTAHENGREKIESVLMTGLGTGQGGISSEKCAQQMILAVKHFHEELPPQLRWVDVRQRTTEVERSTEL